MQKLIVSDIGNSRTKLIYEGKYHVFNNDTNDFFEFCNNNIQKNLSFVYNSVNDDFEKRIIEFLRIKNINYINSEELFYKQYHVDFSNISGMGIDRRTGLIGALLYVDFPFITIDCGTAVTVNVVDKKGICLGGAIFPDIDIQFKSLNEYTSSLPLTDLSIKKPKIGINTNEAIQFGVLSSVSGGIIKALDTIIVNEFNGIEPNLLITGGYSEIILDLIINDFPKMRYYPNLVLNGIQKLAESLNF